MGPVRFDAVDGIGNVPDNGNVDYKGVVAMMRPSRFRQLARPKPERGSADYMVEQIAAGAALAPAFLDVDLRCTPPRVRSHEGRNRMEAIAQVAGDVPVPVHVFFGPLRAHELDPGQVESIRRSLVPQEGGTPLHDNFEQAFWRGQVLAPACAATRVDPALMLYHGSQQARPQFRKGFGDDRGENLFPQAFFFTPDLAIAQTYGVAVTAAHLRIERPYIARTAAEFAVLEVGDAEAFLRARGYDGAVLYLHPDGPPEYVAFDPGQVQVVEHLAVHELEDEPCMPKP
ncbi:hypothetical protein CSC66_08965 [Pseudoxanthomonas kaohsiungensis]|nr:hypothetical protein CSC66_08965 [Pseudoxanthomonas kaohsiungensis]